MEELASLASSAGAEILSSTLQSRPNAEAATLVGSGKVEELALQVKALDPDLVIFDRELTPTQQRNLERELDCRVIDRTLQLNPSAKIFGVTATPNRGDGQGLREVFDNVADQIRIAELIASGHLVKPRTFVIDVGVREDLGKVRKTAADFDMGQVDAIMNKAPVTDQVIAHWREKAGDRQTVAFCSTVSHAENVADAFNANGIPAAVVHGDLDDATRRATLAAYDAGDIQVVVNVAVLTEGWDHPPTSCVVLLRPSSFKSTMIQMVGRGLRTVDGLGMLLHQAVRQVRIFTAGDADLPLPGEEDVVAVMRSALMGD